jgi:hypothetical protein
VQVGINGGQGSVTSPPLVGTAHKIEVEPAELDFGIVIVGNTRERKLTIKNQGVTTVALEVPNTTQNTTSPFRVMLESPVVLGPGESKGVSVQFSTAASGQFTGTVRLFISQALLEIPATAKAYGGGVSRDSETIHSGNLSSYRSLTRSSEHLFRSGAQSGLPLLPHALPYGRGSENSLGEMLSKLEQAMQVAQMAYFGYPAQTAWWLAYGICGGDIGCILFFAEAIAKELEEECGGPCPVPMMYPHALPSRRGGQ